jgi:hypothetical protein
MEYQVCAWVIPCQICGKQSGTGQVFLRVPRCFPVVIIPPSFSILIYHLGDEQYVGAVQRCSPTPSSSSNDDDDNVFAIYILSVFP